MLVCAVFGHSILVLFVNWSMAQNQYSSIPAQLARVRPRARLCGDDRYTSPPQECQRHPGQSLPAHLIQLPVVQAHSIGNRLCGMSDSTQATKPPGGPGDLRSLDLPPELPGDAGEEAKCRRGLLSGSPEISGGERQVLALIKISCC